MIQKIVKYCIIYGYDISLKCQEQKKQNIKILTATSHLPDPTYWDWATSYPSSYVTLPHFHRTYPSSYYQTLLMILLQICFCKVSRDPLQPLGPLLLLLRFLDKPLFQPIWCKILCVVLCVTLCGVVGYFVCYILYCV